MNEHLLQFIWQHVYFSLRDLTTIRGEPLELIYPGILNKDQGPDFLMARLKYEGKLWIGNVELHVTSSAWKQHGHARDPNYENLILHVVWEYDRETDLQIPQLELKGRVPLHLLDQYRKWMSADYDLPCSRDLHKLPRELVKPWLDGLLTTRLDRKQGDLMEKLLRVGMNWEEAFWRELARGFGYKVNADAFEALAAALPMRLLLRYRHNPMQIEALKLRGRLDCLGRSSLADYSGSLYREYCFLRQKHNLLKQFQSVYFLRMRPINFPTIRLAQLAAFLVECSNPWGKVLCCTRVEELQSLFNVEAGSYWRTHYRLGVESASVPKKTGSHFINNLIINVVVPFVSAYKKYRADPDYGQWSGEILRSLEAEDNRETERFVWAGLEAKHAGDTQALLELSTSYCNRFKCLDCSIGRFLLKRPSS